MKRFQQQQQQQQQQAGGFITTKKYKLDENKFISLALKGLFTKLWWTFLIPVAIMLIPIFYAPAFGWCLGIALTLTILWVILLVSAVYGLTKQEQSKIMFEKMFYQINNRQILMMLNTKQGTPIGWDQVKSAKVGKDHFLLQLSMVQFIYLPFSIFKNDMHLKSMENILKRKKLLPSDNIADK